MRKKSLARLLFLVSLVFFTGGCSFDIPGLTTGKSVEPGKDAQVTETALWGVIQTATARVAGPRATATPSLTSTINPYQGVCEWAEIASAEVMPALELVPPNHGLTAKWQLRNVGTCTWDEAYALVFYSGQALGAPEKYYLSRPVAPGETIDIAFPLIAPAQPGQYTGAWKLRNPDGKVVGIGDYPNGSLVAKINVGGEAVTPLPTQNKTPTPTLAPLLLDRCDAVQLMDIITVPDSRSVPPGSRFNVMWRLRNIGGCTWSRKYALQFESGDQLRGASPIYFPREVPPAGILDVYVEMRSPITAGTYTGNWKIHNDVNTTFGKGVSFNEPLVVSIQVNRSITATPIPPTRTPLPTSTKTPVSTSTTVYVSPVPSSVPDLDKDGVTDSSDNCPAVSNPGQTNTDGDTQGDVCDENDDNDNLADSADNCPLVANNNQLDTDGDAKGDACDTDDDNDAVLDGADNCPLVGNADQTNTDGAADGGDACDSDDDNDGDLDGADNCPLVGNADQTNTDGAADGGDACDTDDDNDAVLDGADNCPLVGNADQTNTDGAADGGDACDADDDNDGVEDGTDNCPLVGNVDQTNTDGAADGGDACDADDDNDGVDDGTDNCPLVANPGQEDLDTDGIGDACDT